MLKSSSSTSSKLVNRMAWRRIPASLDPTTGEPRPAEAIVILMGWWGAQPRHLDRYVSLYQSILPSVAVVAGTASSTSILWYDTVQLREFAQQGLEATAATFVEEQQNIRTTTTQPLPILVHVFSNGGAFVWLQMMDILEKAEKDAVHKEHHPINKSEEIQTLRRRLVSSLHGSNEESGSHYRSATTQNQSPPTIALLRRNIQCQIYDSSPAYPSFNSGFAALEGSGMIRNRFVLRLVKYAFVAVFWLEACWDRLRNRPHRIMEFWRESMEKDWDIPQGFIYSLTDRMVDADHLQDFIRERQMRSSYVSVLKFEESPHVQHLRYHPNEYKDFVSGFVQQKLLQNRNLND